MAIITGTSGAYSYRYTYTYENINETTARITITKVEVMCAGADGTTTYPAGNFSIQYPDSSGGKPFANWAHGSFRLYNTFKTAWTGSVSFTGARFTADGDFLLNFGGCRVTISARPSYTISYDANGGTNPPTTQNKYYGYDLYLSSGKPTKLGYTFLYWLCSSDGQRYSPGSKYTNNVAATMTAQWKANIYTVSYDSNGGTGSVPNQSKTYNIPLNFQLGSEFSNKDLQNGITREYRLLKWNSQLDGSGNEYALGSEIPNITSDLKVYAIWEIKYLYPYISNLQAYRTATSNISDKERAAKGEYIYISFDFIGCSSDNGVTYNVPNCKITIDEDEYTPTLTFDSGTHSGSAEFKANVIYSMDNPHNVTVELVDPNYQSSIFRVYDYITTSVYPIDLFDNPDTNTVFMGIMHPYTNNELLTIPDTYIDGELKMHLDVDANASRTTPAVSGEDRDLFNAILENGWYDDVINSEGKLLVKKQLWKTSEPDTEPAPLPDPKAISFTYRSNSYFPSDRVWVTGYKFGYVTVLYINIQSSAAMPSGYSANIGTVHDIAKPSGTGTMYGQYTLSSTGQLFQVSILDQGWISINNMSGNTLAAGSRIQLTIPIITTF